MSPQELQALHAVKLVTAGELLAGAEFRLSEGCVDAPQRLERFARAGQGKDRVVDARFGEEGTRRDQPAMSLASPHLRMPGT